jgi:hypothetical protein
MKRTVLCAFALGSCGLFGTTPCRAQSSGAAAAATTDTSTAAVGRCVADHESARLQRVREQWLEARDAMTRCSDDGCPLAIRSDCRAWLDELTRMLPTVLIVVERDDESSQPLTLELDGQPLVLPEPLGPIELLPGSHHLRATLPPFAPIDREIVLARGVKNQLVRIRFAAEQPAAVSEAPPPARTHEPPRSSRPIPPLAYLFGGGALLAFGTSGVLLGSALSSLSSARDTCAPSCAPSQRESIDARLLAADVVGGAGVVLAGLALATILSRPTVIDSHSAVSAKLDFSTTGGRLSLSGQF